MNKDRSPHHCDLSLDLICQRRNIFGKPLPEGRLVCCPDCPLFQDFAWFVSVQEIPRFSISPDEKTGYADTRAYHFSIRDGTLADMGFNGNKICNILEKFKQRNKP